MKKQHCTLAAITAAVLALSACNAHAAPKAGAPAPQAAAHRHAAVSVTPLQAIAAAQKQAGGQANEVKLKGKHGTPVYEVEVRNGQTEHTVYVDAANGSIVGSKQETEYKPMRPAAISLERAINIAQGKVNGRVLEAERDGHRGQNVYKVEILSADNVPYKVIVDADSGNVVTSFVDYDD